MAPDLSAMLAPNMRVFVAGMSNESAVLNQELAAHPERARGVDFRAIQFPGIDRMDYLGLHPEARQSSYFMTPALRAGLRQGRAELYSLDYPGIVEHLRRGPAMDLAIAQISAPDADGWCAPGLACDFMPLAWARARRRVAHINPLLPRLASSFRVHLSELDASVVSEQALLDFKDPPAGEVERRIGTWVAPLVHDGNTLQFGIGSVPLGLAGALKNHRRLKFHGGLVSSALQTLWEAGAMDRDARITTGVVLGDAAFRNFVRELPQLWLTDVSQTHDVNALSRMDGLVAINSAIEVDLLGQVNAERSSGLMQAGAGGLPAFARGALSAPNGRLLICLPATARKGAVSRIVPTLGHDAVCTLPRYLVDTVVTENGVAEIRHLSPEARAQALIGIAAAEHQPALEQAWADIRQKL
jgi:acyl-CoA hydrolase